MPGRSYQSDEYRFGFNGKENDNEVKGTGDQQDYGFRIYDPRLGRFLSVDPLTKSYPMLTPYQFASNTPIEAIDLDGLEASHTNDNAPGAEQFNPSLPGDNLQHPAPTDANFGTPNPQNSKPDDLSIKVTDNFLSIFPADAINTLEQGRTPDNKKANTLDKIAASLEIFQSLLITTEGEEPPMNPRTPGRSLSGQFTEPTLPQKTIVNENGVKVEHYYKSGDHTPAHAHVSGSGPNTKIGANGKPIKGSPELSAAQRKVVTNNSSTIRSAVNKINKYNTYKQYKEGM